MKDERGKKIGQGGGGAKKKDHIRSRWRAKKFQHACSFDRLTSGLAGSDPAELGDSEWAVVGTLGATSGNPGDRLWGQTAGATFGPSKMHSCLQFRATKNL